MSSGGQPKIRRKAVGSSSTQSLELKMLSEDGNRQVPRRGSEIHWKAYTTMLVSLLLGMLLSLGHHLFYHSLDGKPVSNHPIHGVTGQQLNLAIGTLFAFLVKASLAVAVTTAYTQVLWRAIKQQPMQLTTIDTIFDAATNFWGFFRFGIWGKYLLLLLLALTIWLIPIPSIVTPAALTVAIAPLNPVPTEMLRVPQIDFLSLNFANIIPAAEANGEWVYTGPRNAVDKIVAATVAQGSILPITNSPAAPNSSWALEFAGPSLTCTDLEGSALDAVNHNIQTAVGIDNCTRSFGYVGWTPSYNYSPTTLDAAIANFELVSTLPFILSPNNTSYTFQDGSIDSQRSTKFLAATSNITTFGNVLDPVTCAPGDPRKEPNPLPNATVIQCVLYNASYKAAISFLNGQQTINVTVDPTPYNSVIPFTDLWGGGDADGLSPFATYTYPANGTPIFKSWNTTRFQALSYKSIMDSFSRIVVGTIYTDAYESATVLTSETSVLSTVLSETNELARLNNQEGTFQQLSQQYPGELWNGVDSVDISPTMPLKDALESLFQNITIGLMSSKLLQPNISSPYAPSNVSVALPRYQAVYVYAPARLWIAYGLAILFTAISVIIGLLAMVSNGVAYTNHFSTILRTTRFANIDPDVLPENGDGKDPMPNRLARAIVSFSTDGIEMRRRDWLGDRRTSIVTKRLLPDS